MALVLDTDAFPKETGGANKTTSPWLPIGFSLVTGAFLSFMIWLEISATGFDLPIAMGWGVVVFLSVASIVLWVNYFNPKSPKVFDLCRIEARYVI